MPDGPTVRPARRADAAAIATIHGEGIGDRAATFRTDPRPEAEVEALLADGRPALVAERDGEVIGWAWASPYDDAASYYEPIREATVFVARSARRAGAGLELLAALEDAVADAGYSKLIAKIFTANEASIALFRKLGWREVGVHLRHGRLDDEWKDVLVMEKLVGAAAT